MSIGFRIFLLILFGFGTVYAYRFRATDLDKWLSEPRRSTALEAAPEGLASPVNGILPPDVVLAFLQGPVRGLPLSVPQVTDPWDEAIEDYLPPGEVGAEDLALMDPELSADGTFPPPLTDEYEPLTTSGDSPATGEPPEDVPLSVSPGDSPAIVATEELTYTVKDGDNLWKIAEQQLGAGARYREIRQLNRDLFANRSSNTVAPGMLLRIGVSAQKTVLEESLKVPDGPVDSSVEESSPSGSNGPTGEPTHHKVRHKVRRNENLRRIASRYFPGKTDGWKRIFEANRDLLDSADRIREGQVLTIPSLP